MNITKNKIDTLPSLGLASNTNHHNNGGNLYKANEEILYKVFKDFYAFQDEVERNIDFQIDNPIPNTPRIYDKLFIDGKFSGYSMEYIHNSITFREAINKGIDQQTKLQAIEDVYTALKFLHQNNIFLGDIHSDNFLINADGHGYIIDLDYMRFPLDEYKFQQCYVIKPNDNAYKENIASKYTDNAKLMISSLSPLLDKDLENFISKNDHTINLEEINNKVILPLNDSRLDDYFMRLQNHEDVEYFSDFLSYQNSFKSGKKR
ncbi:MAG TPA: hypothetical protein IAB45_00930 [Candidatus Onthousia faecavium]|nr:hypothetical protein [Candidatus Onthousia faecavium]